MRRPGSCAITPRIVNGWPPIISRSPTCMPELDEELRADERAAAGEQVVAVGAPVGERERPVERKRRLDGAQLHHPRHRRALLGPHHRRRLDRLGLGEDGRVGQNRVDAAARPPASRRGWSGR